MNYASICIFREAPNTALHRAGPGCMFRLTIFVTTFEKELKSRRGR